MAQQQAAAAHREAYLRSRSTGPWQDGAVALEWESRHPDMAKALTNFGPSYAESGKLMKYANELNAQAQGQPVADRTPTMPALHELMAQVAQEQQDRRSGLAQAGDNAGQALAATGKTLSELKTGAGRMYDRAKQIPGDVMIPLTEGLFLGQPGPGPKQLELQRRKNK